MTRIALVDDDDLFRESLNENLRDAGHDVVCFDRGEGFLGMLDEGGGADLVLLDWKMPGITGIDVLRRMRDQAIDIPVIFLTVLSDQIYEEAALTTGAVDFVDKSRSFHILSRRIDLILSGTKGAEDRSDSVSMVDSALVTVGRLELKPGLSRASWGGMEVNLTLGEFQIVQRLAGNPGQDCRYRDLYDCVRGSGFLAGAGAEGYKTNVRTFIKRIRQKFREIDPSFDEIENYPGFGYRWRND